MKDCIEPSPLSTALNMKKTKQNIIKQLLGPHGATSDRSARPLKIHNTNQFRDQEKGLKQPVKRKGLKKKMQFDEAHENAYAIS
jgi:hypothetical protein